MLLYRVPANKSCELVLRVLDLQSCVYATSKSGQLDNIVGAFHARSRGILAYEIRDGLEDRVVLHVLVRGRELNDFVNHRLSISLFRFGRASVRVASRRTSIFELEVRDREGRDVLPSARLLDVPVVAMANIDLDPHGGLLGGLGIILDEFFASLPA